MCMQSRERRERSSLALNSDSSCAYILYPLPCFCFLLEYRAFRLANLARRLAACLSVSCRGRDEEARPREDPRDVPREEEFREEEPRPEEDWPCDWP